MRDAIRWDVSGKVSRDKMREQVRKGLQKALPMTEAQWLPEYEGVINWLMSNDGKGLLMVGSWGRGKTTLARWVLPPLITWCVEVATGQKKVVPFFGADAISRDRRLLDEVTRPVIKVVDDFGTEYDINDYGTRIRGFVHVMDDVEKEKKLIILTTNLTGSEMQKKYGDATIQRLISCCSYVKFCGESLRK